MSKLWPSKEERQGSTTFKIGSIPGALVSGIGCTGSIIGCLFFSPLLVITIPLIFIGLMIGGLGGYFGWLLHPTPSSKA
jgi:hypothetical protein